ncbi:MAG TPA: T9SS type A sorting domain-containing protein [Alphaproteobacteria bacterium]|nr:T9SS type A sorting domain-containing protein [Alphaproteobacteria bacterium]
MVIIEYKDKCFTPNFENLSNIIFNSLDVSSLTDGIYLIELSNGQKTTTRKLIKK